MLTRLVCVTLSLLAVAADKPQKPDAPPTAIPIPHATPFENIFEPHLAVDPDNLDQVLVTGMLRGQAGVGKDAGPDSRILVWRSGDGGRTWSAPALPLGGAERPTARIASDPVLACGKGGHCWLSACHYEWQAKAKGEGRYRSIKVCPSDDGGKTWGKPIAVTEFIDGKTGSGFVDKQWVAVDTTSGTRKGTLYVAWTRLDVERGHSELLCAAISPGAREAGASVRLGSPVGLNQGTFLIHLVQLAVRTDGTLDAVWWDPSANRLVHASSSDGAKSFSKPVPVVDEAEETGSTFPSLTAAADGKVLVAWVRNGDVLTSVLASGRWSPPRPLAAKLPERTRLTHPAAAAAGGFLWVLAYRTDSEPRRVKVVLYRSADSGTTWTEDRVLAARPLPAGGTGRFTPGDYVGLAAGSEVLYAAYVLPGEKPEPRWRELYVARVAVSTKP